MREYNTLPLPPSTSVSEVPAQAGDPTPCHHCGVIDTPVLSAGTGPHAIKASCGHCHRFLRWVSRSSAEERVHRQQEFRRQAMAKRLPTPRQLSYLLVLGYKGSMPDNQADASRLIDEWQQQGGKP